MTEMTPSELPLPEEAGPTQVEIKEISSDNQTIDVSTDGAYSQPVDASAETSDTPSVDIDSERQTTPLFGEPTTEVPAVDYGRVTDESKAWDMAYAGKDEREHALKSRAHVNTIEDNIMLVDEDREIAEGDGTPLSTVPEKEIQDIESRARTLDSLRPSQKLNSGLNELRDAYNRGEEGEEDSQRIRDRLKSSAEGLREESARYDDKADKLENWAGILHDNPVSESYRVSHQPIEFTPTSLYFTDMESRRKIETANEKESKLDNLPVQVAIEGLSEDDQIAMQVGIEGVSNRPVTTTSMLEKLSNINLEGYKKLKQEHSSNPEALDRAIDPVARDLYDRYISLTGDPKTTIEDLLGVFKDTYRALNIDPMRRSGENFMAVLDDIREGRASEPKTEETNQ